MLVIHCQVSPSETTQRGCGDNTAGMWWRLCPRISLLPPSWAGPWKPFWNISEPDLCSYCPQKRRYKHHRPVACPLPKCWEVYSLSWDLIRVSRYWHPTVMAQSGPLGSCYRNLKEGVRNQRTCYRQILQRRTVGRGSLPLQMQAVA